MGQGLLHWMDDQPGVGRDSFGTGNKRELTECSLPSLRENVSFGRRCCRAGLIPWSGQVGLEGKRRKCNFQKDYGGIMHYYCLWQRCDLVLLQIRDAVVPEAGWRVLDVSAGCCLRGSGRQGSAQFSSTLRM